MEITPAKMAFIKGQETKELKPAAVEAPPSKLPVEKIVKLQQPAAENNEPKESRSRASRLSSRGRSSQEAPEASEVLDQVLVPVTVRLPHRMAQSLRRAYLEQRLKHAKPDTQQEIVEEALGDWLSRQGFME
ncbi:MAG: hypothetical protein WD851_17225 [Pirellulales bacterium]